MLRTLLESRLHRQSNSFGTAASTAVHLVLITLAAYGTVTHARAQDDDDPPPVYLNWQQPEPASAARPASKPRASRDGSNVHIVRGPAISIDVSSQLPDLDLPLGSVRNDDFTSSAGESNAPGESAGGLSSGPKTGPYDSYEVDFPVASIGGTAPVYPPAMRAAGIEGEVKAEFVVNSKGQAETKSLRIISATNERFADAVRDALPRMRFAPARLRGQPVAQLVQQLFVFRLDR